MILSRIKNLFGKKYYYLWGLIWSYHIRNKEPILVYQMGKVGSRTIAESFKSYKDLNSPIIHVHVLSNELIEKGELLKKSQLDNNFEYLRNIEIRKLLNYTKDKKRWKVITLVREPVARNISAFFENIKIWFPDKSKIDDVPFETLFETFIEKFDHQRPLEWFDLEIKNILGIDIYLSDFQKEKGFQIISSDHYDLLIIKLEKMRDCGAEAVNEFFQLDNFSLVSTNVGDNKYYNKKYKEFLHNVKLSDSFLKKMYDSKYTNHFYSPDEIDSFIKKWT